MGPVKTTRARVAAVTARCWILVGSSLCRHKPATSAKGERLVQIVQYHSSSPILMKVLSALQNRAEFLVCLLAGMALARR